MKNIFGNKITELKAQLEGTENPDFKKIIEEAIIITKDSAKVFDELEMKKNKYKTKPEKVYKTSNIPNSSSIDTADLDDETKKLLKDWKSISKDIEKYVRKQEKAIDIVNKENLVIGLKLIEYHESALKKIMATLNTSQENIINEVYNNSKDFLFSEEVKTAVATFSEELGQVIELAEVVSEFVDIYNEIKSMLDSSKVISEAQLIEYTNKYSKAVEEWIRLTKKLTL